MAMTRRTLLKYGLGGALLLAAGGIGLSLRETVPRQPRQPLKALDARSFSILAAIADRIAPGGGGFPTASAIEVPEKIDDLLSRSHPALVAEVVQVLGLFENALAGFLFEQRFQTFTASPPDVQDQVIDDWRSSTLSIRRTAYKALQGLVVAAYYASPEIYPLVGYPGSPDFGNVRPAGEPSPPSGTAPGTGAGAEPVPPSSTAPSAEPVPPSGLAPVAAPASPSGLAPSAAPGGR